MITQQDLLMALTAAARRWLIAGAAACALLGTAACNDFFNVQNTNQPTLDDLLQNPTRSKLTAAATGIFAGARAEIQGFIWRVGSMGREGINLSGNNQPDYQEPYFGPLQGGGFGGALWGSRYANIKLVDVYQTALGRVATTEVSATEKAGSRAVANTLKALALLYVIETRDSLGAPVTIGLTVDAPPAPIVSQDSVYKFIIALLDSAQADLGRAGSTPFPFPVPTGLVDFNTPATFGPFNRALAAKAQILRATAAGCGSTCYTAALTALAGSFISPLPANYAKGAYFDFSNGANDTPNGLSEPLNGVTYYALRSDSTDAQLQPGGQPDQRVIDKITAALDTQRLGGILIPGELKFTIYFTSGAANPAHPIPIIRDEELILLRAEAEWFTGAKAQALVDVDSVRIRSGKLAPTTLTIASTDNAFLDELLYNRRYSLLWEQGTRWVDARRYDRLATIPPAVTGGSVPSAMPFPDPECNARGLANNCDPLH